jgi:hypothetical protein
MLAAIGNHKCKEEAEKVLALQPQLQTSFISRYRAFRALLP